MQPTHWQPPVELSSYEQAIAKRIKRAKLFVFLREIRHELFDEDFQNELNQMYQDSPVGQPPIAPAQVALTMVRCRQAMINHRLERRLIERTIELATKTGGFGSRQLRVALDSSPLWGAGRVEDTYNLLGHALKKALGVIAAQQGRELSDLASEAGATIVSGSSLKAALDLNWEDPNECLSGLQVVLGVLERVSGWMARQPQVESATVALGAAEQVKAQDVIANADGTAQLKKGVARNRRISLEDPHMRHGRKSKHHRVDGYKRHILRDLDSGLVPCVGITPANVPEAWVSDAIVVDLNAQKLTLSELHIDRADLTSKLVRHRSDELAIYCKAWSVRNRQGLFAKTAFTLDWTQNTICCPNGISIPFTVGKSVHFPAQTCASCPLKAQCTTSAMGRHVSIHPDERGLQELRQRQLTPQGRAKLRERVAVEHSLAHIAFWQGERARYLSLRKNLFDLRRMAVVHNLHVLAHLSESARYTAP